MILGKKDSLMGFKEPKTRALSLEENQPSQPKRKKKLNELTLDELKKIEPKLKEDVLKVFNLKNSINSKKSYGGTSFDNIKKMIMKYKKEK